MQSTALLFEPQTLVIPGAMTPPAAACQPAHGLLMRPVPPAPVPEPASSQVIDLAAALPLLQTTNTTLRELRPSDAPSLLALLSTEEVSRFLSPPPTTLEGYLKFIDWAAAERRAGRHACFAIVPHGGLHAVGIFQIRRHGTRWDVAEWGFAMGAGFWGTGLFLPSAEAVVRFAFNQLHVHRLEARAAVRNGRGAGALRKVGAHEESVIRRGLVRHGEYFDQTLWVMLHDEWRMPPVRPARSWMN